MARPSSAPELPALVPHTDALAIGPAGVTNAGAVCWLISVLQALASCSAVRATAVRLCVAGAVTSADSPLTVTGRALTAALANDPLPPDCAVEIAARLQHDLAARASEKTELGQTAMGNQCAHEGLILLLHAAWRGAAANPYTQIFLHCSRITTYDANKKQLGEAVADTNLYVDLFESGADTSTPALFAHALQRRLSPVDEHANTSTVPSDSSAPSDPSAPHWRLYQISRAPQVLVVVYNCYDARRRAHDFPDEFALPRRGQPPLEYRLVAQVEHSGTTTGGHYWGRFWRRADELATPDSPAECAPYALNDSVNNGLTAFAPSASTYLLFYHWTDSTNV